MSPRSKTSELLPAQLWRPGSHEVRLSAGGVALAILAAALLLGGCALGVFLFLAGTAEARSTVGEVLELTRERVRYRYTLEGETYTGNHELSRRTRRALAVGSPISVRYSVKNPRRSWIGRESEMPLWVPPFVAVSFAAGPLGIVFALRREWNLLANGRAAVGRVVASKKVHKGGGHGSKTAYRLTVEFRILSGALRTARFDRRRDVALGGNVTVVYDRDDPGRSQLYPFRLVKVV